MAVAQSVIVDLLMRTGTFEADSKKAQRSIKQMEQTFTNAAAKIASVAGIGTLSLGGVAAAVVAYTDKISKAGKEINRLATLSNAGTVEFQKMAYAAKSVGIEQDKLSDILKDVNDKTGEFLSTGGGQMKDFFDKVAPKVGVTAEQFRKLSGPQALQLYVNSLQKAGLNQKQMTFYMEAIANDATVLLPLLKNNGKEMGALGDKASRLGLIMSDETIAASQQLQSDLDDLRGMFSGVGVEIGNNTIPILNAVASEFLNADGKTGDFHSTIKDLVADSGLKDWLKDVILFTAASFDEIDRLTQGVYGLGRSIDYYKQGAKVVLSFGTDKDAEAKRQQAWAEGNKAFDVMLNGRGDQSAYTRAQKALAKFEQSAPAVSSTTKQLVNELQNTSDIYKDTGKHGKKLGSKSKAAADALDQVKKVWEGQAGKRVLGHANQYGYADLESKYGLPKNILAALEMQESRGMTGAVSPVGARGAFQFMPATAKQYGVNTSDVGSSAQGAAKLLSDLLRKFNGDIQLAVNAYNAGSGTVSKRLKSGRDMPAETKGHWKGVKDNLTALGGGSEINIAGYVELHDQVAEYLKQKQEELALTGKTTEAEKLLAEIQLGKYGSVSSAQQTQMLQAVELIEQAQKQQDYAEKYKQLVDEITGSTAIKDYQQQVQLIAQAWSAGEISAAQYQAAINKLSMPEQMKNPSDWMGGFRDGMKQFSSDAMTMNSAVADMTSYTFEQMGNALSDFVTTGKLDFKSLTADILKYCAQMLIKMAIVQALQFALGGGRSGGVVMTGNSSFAGFATGGFVSGAGTGRSDSIPARLSNGEFVINAQATRKHRGLLEAVNSNRYADGGLVGTSSAVKSSKAGANAVSVEVGGITVNNESGGGISGRDADVLGKKLHAGVKSTIYDILLKESRPGGVLNRRG